MFSSFDSGTWRKYKLHLGSLLLHGLLLAFLLHAPEPQRLTPLSIALGRNGNAVTQLYWPTPSPDDSTTSSSAAAREVYHQQRLGHEKLIWKRSLESAKLAPPSTSRSGAEDEA